MIHFHGSPLSGQRDAAGRFYARRHAMVSFAYPEALPIIAEVAQSFVLDNGAFSAWKSGTPMDVDGYFDWCKEWHRHPGFEWCLIPDVIGGTEKQNDEMLEEWKLLALRFRMASVPVWHLDESIDRLQRLCNEFRTVALGSSGQWQQPGTDGWWARMEEAMDAITDDQGRPVCRLHGLRMLNPDIFSRIPFTSADSTNAAQNAGSVSRFGVYPSPEPWQRATVIADRIESINSAAWVRNFKYAELFS